MKKIKKFLKKPVFTLVCYMMAILTAIYLIYTVKLSNDALEMYIAQGSLSWSTNIVEIISFFISNCANYIFYFFAFIFFGRVIDGVRIKDNSKAEEETQDEIIEENQGSTEADEKIIEETVNDDEKSTDKIIEEVDNKEIDEKITDVANEDEN